MAARPQRDAKMLPKLAVTRRRNTFAAKHAPAINLYRFSDLGDCYRGRRTNQGCQDKSDFRSDEAYGHLSKFILRCNLQQGQGAKRLPRRWSRSRTILPKGVSMSMGTIKQNNRPIRFAAGSRVSSHSHVDHGQNIIGPRRKLHANAP